MTLTPRLVAELLRQRLGLPDDAEAARIINLIPQALKATARKIAADPDLRQLLITDRSATTATLASGVVDLTTPYSSFRFLMEYFDLGLVYLLPSATVVPYAVAGTQASGTWTFIGNPAIGDTIDVNGRVFTFTRNTIIVAGSGEPTANMTYVANGTYNRRPYYNPLGEPADPLLWSIAWELDASAWYITNAAGVLLYNNSEEDVATPDLSVSWLQSNGTLPAPTSVTAAALTSVEVLIGSTAAATAANFAAALAANTHPSVSVASYAASGNTVVGTYRAAGSAGNGFTMAASANNAVTVSGATFVGGADTSYRLSLPTAVAGIEDLVRVRFTTTVTLPTGITSSSTDYYITDYTPAPTDSDSGVVASFTLSSTSNGLTPNPITSLGSGVLTMSLMDADGVPLQRLKNPQQSLLSRYLSSVFTYFYWQGNELFVLPASTTGSVAFAVPSYPTNLAALPESEEAEALFLQELMDLVTMPNQER